MNKEDYDKQIKRNIDWLKINIDSDEIYIFAEQTLMAAEFFLDKWFLWEDVAEECRKDRLTHLFVNHVLGIRRLNQEHQDIGLGHMHDWLED